MKKFLKNVIFLFLISFAIITIWSFFSIDKGRILSDSEIEKILKTEQPIISKYNDADKEIYNSFIKSLTEDISNYFEEVKIKKKADNKLRRLIAANANTPLEKLIILSYTDVCDRVAKNPNAPADVLSRLSLSLDKNVRENVAENISTPIEVLRALANDKEISVVSKVASNKSAAVGILNDLSHHKNAEIQLGLSTNPSMPIRKPQSTYYNGEEVGFLNKCLFLTNQFSNSSLDIKVLQEYISSSDECILKGIACNLNSSKQLLERLADFNSIEIKEEVAKNPKTPQNILLRFVQYNNDKWISSENYKEYAFKNPNFPFDKYNISYTDNKETLKKIALNPKLPCNICSDLLQLDNSEITSMIAESTCCHKILYQISALDDKKIIRKIAANKNCPPDLLELFLNSRDEEAGIKGFSKEITGFLGFNPMIIKASLKGSDNENELKKYIEMVFFDNIFSKEELEINLHKIINKNSKKLQSDLVANNNEMFLSLTNNLSSYPEFEKVKINFDKNRYNTFITNQINTCYDQIKTPSQFLSAYSTLTSIYTIVEIVYPLLRKLLDISTKAYSAQNSTGIKAIDMIKFVFIIAIQVGADWYAKYQLEKKINNELDIIKTNLLYGTNNDKGIIYLSGPEFNKYLYKKNNTIVLALKNNIQIED
jgi:hypothetical protein